MVEVYTPPNIYRTATLPTADNYIQSIPRIGDLWVDLSANTLKRCTSTNPYTWLSVEGSGSINFAHNESPTGAINGVNDTYTLAQTPSPSNSLALFYNGALLRHGVDYTLSTNTITMVTVIPQTGDNLRAFYQF